MPLAVGPAPDAVELAHVSTGERRRVALLIRWIAVFVSIPTVTIGLVLYVYDPKEHALHMGAFLILAAASAVVFAYAHRLAARWVPEDA